jgi:3-oxoacyl-[acyl-carrier protein] reductase
MDLGLEDSTVLVAAASKGLGRAAATQFVAEGARVCISSRSEENLAAAKDHILAETDAPAERVHTVVCDLSDPITIPDTIGAALDDLGGLDVLVTNHGGTPAMTFEEASVADFDDAYDSVLKSAVVLVKTCLPHLEASEGAITHLISASTLEPPTGSILNAVIRPGIYGLSKSLANEYGAKGVRSNCVAPRAVMTDRIEYKIDLLAEREGVSVEEATEMRTEELPIGRVGQPPEFAKAVAYVSSPAAGFTTGSTIHVDGGWHRSAF